MCNMLTFAQGSGDPSAWRQSSWSDVVTIYASKMQRAGRRHLVARVFNVSAKRGVAEAGCNTDTAKPRDWQ